MTVMDSQELHARPLSNEQTMLDDAPGISLQRSGALDSQIVVRGLSSNDARMVLFHKWPLLELAGGVSSWIQP